MVELRRRKGPTWPGLDEICVNCGDRFAGNEDGCCSQPEAALAKLNKQDLKILQLEGRLYLAHSNECWDYTSMKAGSPHKLRTSVCPTCIKVYERGRG